MIFEPEIGKRFVNRAGAVLRVVQIHTDPRYRFVTLVIERQANGAEPDCECKVSVGPDGLFCAGWPGTSRPKSPLDLLAEVPDSKLGPWVNRKLPQQKAPPVSQRG